MPADLDDTDKAFLAELLRDVIAADRSPLSPRITKLLAPLASRSKPSPPPRPAGEPSRVPGEEEAPAMVGDLAAIIAIALGGVTLTGSVPTNPGTVAIVVFAGLASLIPAIPPAWRR